MRSGVRLSWRAFGIALLAVSFALTLLVAASSQDSWGSLAQYPLGSLAVLALAAIGYVVGQAWVLLLPWAVVAAWAVAVAAVFAVSLLNAMPSPDFADVPYGLALLVTYSLVVDIPLAVGLAVALVRARHRRDEDPYPS